jgi:hypothetical protein
MLSTPARKDRVPGLRPRMVLAATLGILSFDSAQDRLSPLARHNDDFPEFVLLAFMGY